MEHQIDGNSVADASGHRRMSFCSIKAGGTPVSLVICDPSDDFCQELDVAATIIRDFGAPKIIVLTRRLTEPRFELALKSGVSGFLSKDIAPEALLPSLRVVLLGGQVFAPHRLTCKLQPMRMEPVAPTTPDIVAMAPTMPTASGDEASSESAVGLSEREVQIVRCLVDGLANKQIARNLNIAEATVKVHLKGAAAQGQSAQPDAGGDLGYH
jgi:two-component system nitrate/nitrite response regulator NarL